MTKIEKNLIGTIKQFNGYFDLFQTDNIFRFFKPTKIKKIKRKNFDNTITTLGRIHPRVKINSRGMIIRILNKKEGLFIYNKYPISTFKFLLKNL